MKTLEKLLSKSNYKESTFAADFNKIIENNLDGYDGNPKQQFKAFAEDLQRSGCVSGMIGSFVYNSDCKEFYIKHIDDLEQMRDDLDEQIGEPIQNRHKMPHYTFVCWLCFEEYVNDLYNEIFEQ